MSGSRFARWSREDVAWRLLACAVALVVLGLVRSTLMEGVWFWDTAEAQTVPPLFGTMHPTGFPAYAVLGWLASLVLTPLGDPAFRMNLLSAILVAVAGGGAVLTGRRLGVPAVVAAAAALGFALTPIVWQIGSSADAHALHLALAAGLVLLLLVWEHAVRTGPERGGEPGPTLCAADRRLVVAAAWFGVLLANHALTFLLVPAVGLYVLAVDRSTLARPRLVATCIAATLGVAALLYLQLPLRAGLLPAPIVYADPSTWDGFWYIVLAEQFRGSIVDPLGNLGGKFGALVDLTSRQLGPLAWLLPLAVIATARRAPRYLVLSGTAVAVTCFFAASYENAQIERYYLVPAFLAWTWLAVLGGVAVDLLARVRVRREPANRLLLGAALAVLLVAPTLIALPVRRGDVIASQGADGRLWLDQVMTALEPDAIILSSWSFSTTLWYGQFIEGRRPDVRVVDDRDLLDDHLGDISDVIDANLGRRPVYVARLDPSEVSLLGARYQLEAVAGPMNVYRVLGTLEAPNG